MAVTVKDVAAALGIARRVAARKLEGVPHTIERGPWGQRKVYAPQDLPRRTRKRVMDYLVEQKINEQPQAPASADAGEPEPHPSTAVAVDETHEPVARETGSSLSNLARWQIDVGTARLVFVDEIEHWAEELGRDGAIRKLERLAKARELPERLRDLVLIANARSGAKSGRQGRTLSRGRLYDWCRKVRGRVTPSERICALAPKSRGRKWDLDADVLAALAKYRQPNKPSLADCVRQVISHTGGSRASLEHRCRRAMKHVPAAVFHAGRNTGAALKALRPFRRREFLSLAPNEVWVGDGHAAKLKVAHPITGNPFQPEVTAIMDVSDRSIVGWSVALSENCLAVSDALRHAVGRHGIPLIYYSDNGGGQKNKMLDAPVTGICGALGVQHETGIPGNPQGRGVMERLWPTVLISLARRFPTFQGRGHDRDTLKNVSREIGRSLRAAKSGEIAALPRKLPTWQQFLDALALAIGEYNETHQHSSLPKLGGATHATPAQWRAHRLDQSGAVIDRPAPDELAMLFMPRVMRKAERGEVKLFNGIYAHADLMLIDGKYAPVGYDIHDCSRVWVHHPEGGQLIAVAELNGNRSEFFPVPMRDRLKEQRAKRRLGLLQSKAEEVRAELDGSFAIECAPLASPPAILPAPDSTQTASNVIALVEDPNERPWFRTDPDKYRWLMSHPQAWDAEDARWLLEFAADETYTGLEERFERQGFPWGAADAARARMLLTEKSAAG